MQNEEQSGSKEVSRPKNVADHLANERTLLAWVRTGIGIMAFGFVVVKFSLFVRQMALVMGKGTAVPNYGYSEPVGILLVAIGALSLLLALWRYHKTARQLDQREYYHDSRLLNVIVGIIVLMGIILIVYLLKTT